MPTVRVADLPQARADGSVAGVDYLEARSIEIDLDLYPVDVADLATAFVPARAAEDPLTFQLDDGPQFTIWCRPRGWRAPMTIGRSLEQALASALLVASDPIIYSADETETVLDLPAASGSTGVAFPWTFPITFDETAYRSGEATITNEGHWPTGWTAVISPGAAVLVDPRLTHVESGKVIWLRGLTLNPGSRIVLGTYDDGTSRKHRQVLEFTDGTTSGASRRGAFVAGGSEFFEMEPGDNTVRFDATSSVAGPSCTFRTRSGWIQV